MMMDNRAFAEELYEFLWENDVSGHYAESTPEECIAELEQYLSDLHMVTETIKDIEEIADMFDDHAVYVSEVKPLLQGLREIEGKLEAEQRRRIVSDTKYEVTCAIHVGDKEILFAEDKNAEGGKCWFVGDYTDNGIIGQYADCVVCDDYLEAVQVFTARVDKQIEAVREEIRQINLPTAVFTAEHCLQSDYGQSIVGKIVAIKADVLRPAYRRGDVQLVLVESGNGSGVNPMGRAVYCYHLNTGEKTRFQRHDVQGEVKPECIPQWAKDKAAEILSEKSSPPPKKPKDREGR